MSVEIIESLKKELNILDCCQWWLGTGSLKGGEWVVCNPMRKDSKPGSFKINVSTGAWADFAVPGVQGGDMVSLFAYLNGIDSQVDAANKLINQHRATCKPSPNKAEVIHTIIPIPPDIPTPVLQSNCGHYVYDNQEGKPILHLIRYEHDGKKTFMPTTWAVVDGVARWVNRGFYDHGKAIKEKPLYGMGRLYARPTDTVLLVEGEKTADAANVLLPEFVGMTWLGGSNNAKNADLQPLLGRDVWLWPDNDEAGKKAMETIRERLKPIAKSAKIVDFSSLGKLPQKWDLADAVESMDIRGCFAAPDKLEKDSFPFLSEKGNVLNMAANTEHLLKYYNIKVRYNTMTHYPEFYAEGRTYSTVNEADCYFQEICDKCVFHGIPRSSLENHINFIADKERYHPAVEFIESKPWDGISRVKDFIRTIETDTPLLAFTLIYKWMLGAVAAAYSDEGISLDGMLVIQGEQLVGKSYWFIRLVPKAYRHLVKGEQILDPNNKDSVMNTTSAWLTGLGELDATIRKSQVSVQKAFLTQAIDMYRVPFGKRIRPVPRRTAFYGSVNPQNFLADDTGNRRYWTIKAKSIDYNHTLDMQQVWSEFKFLLDSGETYRLTREEHAELNNSNADFELIEPIQELLETCFDWEAPCSKFMTCTEILKVMGYENPTRAEANKLAILLNRNGSQKGIGRSRRSYFMPQLKISTKNINW